jgi:SMP-30/Gluconolactonase/LRE-like region
MKHVGWTTLGKTLVGIVLGMAATVASAQTVLSGVGFENSESSRYDDQADEYLVSNIGARGPENNGFISRVGPDGQVKALKWVAGGQNGAMLFDPLGVYLKGNLVYLADPKAVRKFDRKTGAYVGSVEVPGATRLNDLVVTNDGTVYVTDSGNATTAGAIYKISAKGKLSVFAATSPMLENPNGIAIAADGSVVHGGRGVNLTWRKASNGKIIREQTLPTGRFDGIVLLPDGALLVASQDGHCVYRVPADGSPATVVAKDIAVPAAIGYDTMRKRLLVPQIALSSLTIYELGN